MNAGRYLNPGRRVLTGGHSIDPDLRPSRSGLHLSPGDVAALAMQFGRDLRLAVLVNLDLAGERIVARQANN